MTELFSWVEWALRNNFLYTLGIAGKKKITVENGTVRLLTYMKMEKVHVEKEIKKGKSMK